jgi:hypothetical protein
MGLPQLENLVRIRQLKEESPAQAEIDGLIRSVTEEVASRVLTLGPPPMNERTGAG